MKHFGFLILLPSFIVGIFSSCGGEIERDGETKKQPQIAQSSIPQSESEAPKRNIKNEDTLVGINREVISKPKKSKKIIIPQVIPPDPDPDPWPYDPYWGWEPIDPPLPVEPEPPGYVEPVLIAEVEAAFPGGQSEMMKFINNNIKISEFDLELGCQGKVYVRIVVTTEGKVTNPEVLKGIKGCPGLSKSALDVVALMPDWIPAVNYGKKVSSYVTFPIVIKYQ